jgi:hypothetical protein
LINLLHKLESRRSALLPGTARQARERGEQFIALRWLASHDCEAEAEFTEAESLIGAYQLSPDSGLIRGQLERLHRKP